MSKKDMVDRLRDMNKLLVGRLKEKEKEVAVLEEFKSGRWFERAEVDVLVRDAVAEACRKLELGYERERRGQIERALEVSVQRSKEWREKEAMWEASLEVEKRRVDELSKSVSQHREAYREEVDKGRANEKRSLEDMVAQVVGGKKRRVEEEKKVGTKLDPEKAQPFQVKVGVKVGGVLWEDGVDGVLVGLREMGFTICEGSRWLVGETERAKRRERGKNSSTVLAMIGGGARAASELCRSGVWVGARWCSVKRFVAIPPRKMDKGWKGDLKRAAVEVRGELRTVAEECETTLCNLMSIGDIMGRPKPEVEDGGWKGAVKRATKAWKGDVANEMVAEEFMEGFLKGEGYESDESVGEGGGDWKFDAEGKLVMAGGMPQHLFTARGWGEEVRKARAWRKKWKGKMKARD